MKFRSHLSAYAFLGPSLALFALFIYGPFLWNFYVSFHRWGMIGTPEFVGLKNYQTLLDDPTFWISLRNTLLFTAGFVPLTTFCSLLVAVWLNDPHLPGRHLFRTTYFIPVISSFVLVSVVWGGLLNLDYGVLNQVLGKFGLGPIPWLTDRRWALPSVILMSAWRTLGYGMVIFLAGLQSIPEEFYEAGRIDGANDRALLWRITVPLLRPITLFVMVILTIQSFQVFDQIYVLTQGGPYYSTSTLVWYVYEVAFRDLKFGYAATLAVALLLLTLAVAWLQLRMFGTEGERGEGRRKRAIRKLGN
jgi:ABC-type sugar transport system permease subunit